MSKTNETSGLCSMCGQQRGENYEHIKTIKERHLCFTCYFWDAKLEFVSSPNSVRIDGEHYFIHPEARYGEPRGHAGRLFHIEFKDGRLVHTTNLWYQGKIPARFRLLMPDNAKFYTPVQDRREA